MIDRNNPLETKLGRDWSFVVMTGNRIHVETRNKNLAKGVQRILREKGRTNVGLYKRNGNNYTFIG